jgi:DNA-binding phage protein
VSDLTKNYRESLLDALQDPSEAAAYLTSALEEGDSAVFLRALRDVVNRENLYRMLSARGNPRLDSLTALLDALVSLRKVFYAATR